MLSSGVPWFGGKHRQRKEILPLLARLAHKLYCELFAGGASVFFGKESSEREVLNDLNGELANYYRCLRAHPAAILDELAEMLVGRDPFYELRERKADHLTDVQRAAVFLYLQRLCYAGKPVGRYFSPGNSKVWSMARRRYEEAIEATSLRIQGAVIENVPWQDCLRLYDRPDSLFYADPPYIEVSVAYGLPFGEADQRELAETLRGIKGTFVVSLNDHPLAREIYRGCDVRTIMCRYPTTARSGELRGAKEIIVIGPPGRSLKARSKGR